VPFLAGGLPTGFIQYVGTIAVAQEYRKRTAQKLDTALDDGAMPRDLTDSYNARVDDFSRVTSMSRVLTPCREQAIHERAYRIWEREGHLHGRHLDHWLRAEAEVAQAYLLDTSVVVGLAGTVFGKLRGWNLSISPYVFWERLCHLDEQPNFQQGKVEFRKFESLRVLDEPRAAIEKPSGRVPDSELICGALKALNDSESLADFYSRQIRDCNNNVYQIAGCVERVRKELEDREARHIARVTEIMKLFTSKDIRQMNDFTKHNHILTLVKAHVLGLAKQGIAVAEENVYFYWSYVFHRALRFVLEGKNAPAKKYCNDYEDSFMCLHLRLGSQYCFGTNDGGARRALDETVSMLVRLND
jgi:hypothetical protein